MSVTEFAGSALLPATVGAAR